MFLLLAAALTIFGQSTVVNYTFSAFTVLSPNLPTSNPNIVGDGPLATNHVLLALKFGVLADDGLGILSVTPSDEDSGDVKLVGPALFYPNPFRLSTGAELGYRLSKNADIQLRIFDMRGNQILKTEYQAGTIGGLAIYNKRTFNRSTLGGYDLSSGVYFFVLSSGQKVIGKGKFVVIP